MQIDVIHDSRHLCTRLRSYGTKTKSRGFSGKGEGGGGLGGGGKQGNESASTRNRGRLKDSNGKLWAEVIIVTFQLQ